MNTPPKHALAHPVLLAALAAALAAGGCATRLEMESAGGSRRVPVLDDIASLRVKFQNPALSPANGGALVTAEALQPGDILLTAGSGLMSVGIQVLTLAPVSHAALYVGDGQVIEAVGEGVRTRSVQAVLEEEAMVVAFRHPGATPQAATLMRDFAHGKVGSRYGYLGVVLHAPFAVERRVCELPLVPGLVRDFCLRGVALVQLGTGSDDRFFCSQFVLEAYRHAGLPITTAQAHWMSPADLLHMRADDVPSMTVQQTLHYVGHLKYTEPQRMAQE
ncbi:distant relative of cell wall-associated hydrolase [Schlegelella sp. S2-27]|uniref:Distant relative of cell wall-associated hydrolase n=1 Tax=Caldimonas mangrovi TaxID=2944811 RepID=A0ABT0YVW1_9BURK|nr:distant relative of cell wall-associated hydrolase [Caldimonas mangrovi]MCM5682246.1 distant relative of cell wall-associated hydrolase [Caldimonas mangrovi]